MSADASDIKIEIRGLATAYGSCMVLRDSLGTTIVVVTHDLQSIFAIGDNSIFFGCRHPHHAGGGQPR